MKLVASVWCGRWSPLGGELARPCVGLCACSLADDLRLLGCCILVLRERAFLHRMFGMILEGVEVEEERKVGLRKSGGGLTEVQQERVLIHGGRGKRI